MSKKSNSKKVKESMQKLNLPSAIEIKIKFIEGNIDYIKSNNDNLLFRTYLLSHLLHKTLSIGYQGEFDFLNSKLKFEILDKKLNTGENFENNNGNFMANQLTEIIIDNSNFNIDNLINDMEQKLNLNESDPQNIEELKEEDKQLLKKIIEEKLGKNKLNELIEYKPINLEDVYKNIISLIQFHIMNNNSEENLNKDSSLLNKNKSFYYRHKGILLCGNSGIGKTHMFNCIKANYLKSENINYFDINIYKDLQIPDKSTNFIKSIFLFSKLLSPTVIFIENIDKIFPNNSSSNEDNSTINNSSEINPLLSEFLLEMEKMSPNIILLASCEMTSKLNPILTKLGFFDYNISLPLPNYNQRKNIIEYILKDFKHNLQEIDINNLSDKSHGFVPGDFVKLFKEAFLKSELSQINIITKDLINNCLGDIKPINLKDIIIDVPRVKWEEIGGNKEIINKIRQSIEWPLKNPEAFKRLGIQPPNGTLLYGPPGCSKTLIAKALATESGLNFFAVKGPELFSKYVGDSEKAVRDIFKKARMSSPSIIFFDEIDAMASSRSSESSGVEDKVLCQLLNEMDGIEGRGKVILFGATNRPDILDKALIRPGRFDRLIYIPPPDEISREEIFKICFKNMKIEKDIDFHELATKTQFFSGADIAKVAREAGMLAIADNINCEYIDKKFILQSIETTKPIINKEMINYFEDFAKKSNEQ
jgi:SpoVK/Ycf46/Vps4 family AAA+-type ATPase